MESKMPEHHMQFLYFLTFYWTKRSMNEIFFSGKKLLSTEPLRFVLPLSAIKTFGCKMPVLNLPHSISKKGFSAEHRRRHWRMEDSIPSGFAWAQEFITRLFPLLLAHYVWAFIVIMKNSNVELVPNTAKQLRNLTIPPFMCNVSLMNGLNPTIGTQINTRL